MVDFIRVKNRLILFISVLLALNLVLPNAYCIMGRIDDNSDEILKQGNEIKDQLGQADKKISDLQNEVNDFKSKEKSHFKIAIIVAIVSGVAGGIVGYFLGKW